MAKSSNTLVLLVLGLVIAVLLFRSGTQVVVQDNPVHFSSTRKHPFDVFSDPYAPPERENPYLFGRDYSYQQVGVLQGDTGMAPLFGRPSPKSSSLWNYFTMKDGLKLPVEFGGRPCSLENGGCPEINGKDEPVNVMGLGSMNSHVYPTKDLGY